MKRYPILLIALFILLPGYALAEEAQRPYFLLFDVCQNNTVILHEYGLHKLWGFDYEEGGFGEYSVAFISRQDQQVFEHKFGLAFLTHGTGIDPETGDFFEVEVELDCIESYMLFPYFEQMSKIQIMKGSSVLYSKDICNYDENCDTELGENEINCLQDCGYQPSGEIPIGPKDPTAPEGQDKSSGKIILMVLALILLVALAAFLLKRRSSKSNAWKAAYEGPSQASGL
jgi:hypothetical protein